MKCLSAPLPTLAILAGLLAWSGSAEQANAQCHTGGGYYPGYAPATSPVIINNSNYNYNVNRSYAHGPVRHHGRYSTVGLHGYYGHGYRHHGYRSYGHHGHHGHGRGFGFSFRFRR